MWGQFSKGNRREKKGVIKVIKRIKLQKLLNIITGYKKVLKS